MENTNITRLFGIRGAACAENTARSIQNAVQEMASKLFSENHLDSASLVSIQFTLTRDLTAYNPAAALRGASCGIDTSSAALFCSEEAYVEGGLPNVIRMLVTAYMPADRVPRHIYIRGAERLRPDFACTGVK